MKETRQLSQEEQDRLARAANLCGAGMFAVLGLRVERVEYDDQEGPKVTVHVQHDAFGGGDTVLIRIERLAR